MKPSAEEKVTGLIFKKIPQIIAEVGAIEKTRKNQQQGYVFRGIDDVYQALQPLLAKNAVFFAPRVIDERREQRASRSGGELIYTILTVEYTFYAEDGSQFQVVTVGEGMDSGDKSSNKAMSAALKYALLQVFCIPTEEAKDSENDSPELGRPKAAKGGSNASAPAVRNLPAGKTGGAAPAKPSGMVAPKGSAKPAGPGQPQAAGPVDVAPKGMVGEAERRHLIATAKQLGYQPEQVKQVMISEFKKELATQLTLEEYQKLVHMMKTWNPNVKEGGK